MKISSRTKRLTVLLPFVAVTLTMLTALPFANAYGKEQWEVAFSGNCNAPAVPCAIPGFPPGAGRVGFWGWCTFGGGPTGPQGVGDTGTNGDCQFTFYFSTAETGPTVPAHVHQEITGWDIGTGSIFIPVQPTPSFFLTSGSMTAEGPGAASFGLPASIPDFTPLCAALPFLCDTGIPAIPGHFDFSGPAGFHLNIQVNRIPNT